MLRFSGFELDSERAELRRPDGGTIKLRPKTLEILRLLAANAGRVLSKQQLMEAVWPNVHVGEDSLFQCIREIRTALGDDKRQVVRVISGRGYLFQAEYEVTEAGVTEVAVPAAPEIAPVSQPGPAEPDTTATVETNSEPAKRLFDFSRRRIAFASVAGLAILCTAVAVWMLRPGLIFARGPDDHRRDADRGREQRSARRPDGRRRERPPHRRAGEDRKHPRAGSGSGRTEGRLRGEGRTAEERAGLDRADAHDRDGNRRGQVDRFIFGQPGGHGPAAAAVPACGGRRSRAGAAHQRTAECRHAIRAKNKVVIEQATAHINQTSPERFQAAQAMLEKALAEEPDNSDVQVALAALLMRGVQMVWLSPAEREAAETKAEAMLQQTLRAKPNYIPAHEAYCRFLNATNQFRASLVACARALSFDPVERDRAVSYRPCPNPDGTFRGRAGDVQAGGPVRYPAGLALDMDDRRRLGQYADGPRRRRRAVATEVDRDHVRQRTHAYVACGGLSATGEDRRSQSGDGKGP